MTAPSAGMPQDAREPLRGIVRALARAAALEDCRRLDQEPAERPAANKRDTA